MNTQTNTSGLWGSAKAAHLLFTLCFMAIFGTAGAQKGPGTVSYPTATRPDTAGFTDTSGYLLIAPANSTTTYLIDKYGNLKHWWTSHNKPGMAVYVDSVYNLYRAEDTLISIGGTPANPCSYPGGLVKKYDSNSNVIWSYPICNPSWQQSHDIYPMPNGNVLADVWQYMPRAACILAHRNPALLEDTFGLWSGMIVEIKPTCYPVAWGDSCTADTIWSWRFWDHLDTSEALSSIQANPQWLDINDTGTIMPHDGIPLYYQDWTHMNAITYKADRHQILISSRNLNEIFIIEHTQSTSLSGGHTGGRYNKGGDFLYRWGNPKSYMGPAYADSQQLYGQHSPYWIPKGYPGQHNIMINNDGYNRGYTTVNMLKPDGERNVRPMKYTSFGPDTANWTYRAPYFSDTRGNAQMLPSGHILICPANLGMFYEVDPTLPYPGIVWQYTLSGGETAFRCTQYEKTYFMNNRTPKGNKGKKK